MQPVHRLLPILLILAVLGALVPAAPPAEAATPATISGVMRYSVHGLLAYPAGIAHSLIGGSLGGPVILARITNALRLFTSLPGLSDNPSMQEMNDFLREGVPVDLAQLGIDSTYDAWLEFTLEQQSDKSFGLQSGVVRWSTANRTHFDLGDHQLIDDLHGSGSATLDPATSSITLTFNFEDSPATFELDVDVTHPAPIDGTSVWRFGQGAGEISYEEHGGRRVWDVKIGGVPAGAITGADSGMVDEMEPFNYPISYLRRAPLSELKGRETWLNVADAQMLVEYELFDSCTAWIEEPGDRMTFDDAPPGRIDSFGGAAVEPQAWGDDLEWTFPDIKGSKLTSDPGDRRGRVVKFLYEGLPEKNSVFGEQEIRATFTSAREECDDPEPQRVRVFFSRDASNNPDGSVPNWFYYWKQTRAGQGHAAAMRYDPGCDSDTLGYFEGYNDRSQENLIYICDLGDFNTSNGVTGSYTEGIDTFAHVVLHEWTHLENYHDWWGASGYDEKLDRDEDLVRDTRESAYGLSPKLKDSLGLGYRDVEYPAFLQEDTWPMGAANREDWANPGKQSGGS